MKLQLGSHLVHKEPEFDRVNEGIVRDVLSAQVLYVTPDGRSRFCLFSEDWQTVTRTTYSGPVVAPAVWKDHQSRTCIVTRAEDGEVCYIPISNEVIELHCVTEKEFKDRRFLAPIDYPVERAARLYVEYARALGASDEVLDALSQFTTISKEEKLMAQTKKKAATAAGATTTGSTKTTKKKAASAAPKEKKPRGPSAASVFMDMLMEVGPDGKTCKHTDDQIFAKVQKQFDLEDKKRSYVSWYRNKLTKDGRKPPEPKGGVAPKGKPGRKKAEAKPAPAPAKTTKKKVSKKKTAAA